MKQQLIWILCGLSKIFALIALGVNQDQYGNFLAVDVNINALSGELIIGNNSNPFIPTVDICVASYNGSSYAISDKNNLQIVNMNGTIATIALSIKDITIISMCYSSLMNSDIFLGWNNSQNIKLRTIGNTQFMSSTTNPQISAINRLNGNITVLQSNIDGGAFIKCVCTINDHAPNNTITFLTSILNKAETEQYIMMVCISGICNTTNTLFQYQSKGITNTLTSKIGTELVYTVASTSYPSLWVINSYTGTVQLITKYLHTFMFAPQAAGILQNNTYYTVLEQKDTNETLAIYNLSDNRLSYILLPQSATITSGLWALN